MEGDKISHSELYMPIDFEMVYDALILIPKTDDCFYAKY